MLSKLLERAVCTQLVSYIKVKSLMPRHQSAYRRRHSTETALAIVFSELISTLDDGNLALMALLDLSAVFDCVDQDILLSRLHITYGIGNTVHSWMSSCLSGRTQSVRVDGAPSRAATVQYGVPQGSVLGPLLFCYTPPIWRWSWLITVLCRIFMLRTRSYFYTVVRIRPNSCKSSRSRALWT